MFRTVSVLALALAALVALASATPIKRLEFDDVETRDDPLYRLPNDTYPINYKVHLNTRVDLDDFLFTGNVEINLGVERQTNLITIHARNLTVDLVSLYRDAMPHVEVPLNDVTYDEDTEFLTIVAADQLTIGNTYTLIIDYWSQLREDEAGFYQAWYENADGEKVFLATTQFESTDARHAFPCYDEPQKKATFDISITHGSRYNAVSNMPVKNRIPVDPVEGTVTTVFETTIPMSTYLLAFVISDYAFVEDGDVVPHQRAYGTPARINDAVFVLEAGVEIMRELENYLNVPYSIAKMDQFGIPQFAAGAMENWGLVTYRDAYFYYNEQTSTTNTKINVATIVAHEYAHQFFGNLVSPKWWTYLWLNEGFATLYEYEATQMAYPKMRIGDTWTTWVVQTVFGIDSSDSTRPMTHYAESPRAISNLFDRVAYPKSGSVLCMIKHFMTEPVWKKGLETYLTTMSFKAAEADDFFAGLQTALDASTVDLAFPIKTILDTWTMQKGYPLVEAHRLYDAEGAIHFTQARFMDATKVDPLAIRYHVPINIARKSNPQFDDTSADFWLTGAELHHTPATANIAASGDWIIVNKKQGYYYRVNYDEQNWLLLAEELSEGDFTKINIFNRAQLIDDAIDLARYEFIDYSIPFHILKYLKKELDYVPWRAADPGLTEIYRLFRDSETSGYFSKFFLEIADPFYKSLGAVSKLNDDELTRLARVLAIKWACRAGSEACWEGTNTVMKAVINDGATIEPDLKASIYCHGMRGADAALFTKFLGQMKDSDDGTERSAILTGLACNEQASAATAMDEIVKNEGNVFTAAEQRTYFNSWYLNSAVGYHNAIHYAIDHADAIKAIYTGNTYGTLLSGLATYATTEHNKEEIESLVEKYSSDISQAVRTSIANQLAANLAFVEANKAEMATFLVEYYDGAASSVIVSATLVIVAAVTSYSLF